MSQRGCRALLGVAAVLGLLLSAASASAAPFANGSFETPRVGGFIQRNAGYDFGDWVVTAGSVDHIAGYWQAAAGSQSIDLDGASPGRLCQTFDTATPGSATVAFMLSHNPVGASSGTVQVLANGIPIGTFTHNVANTRPNMLWQSHSANFTVTGATTQLCFQSLTPGAFGPAIDAVAFTQPTPPLPPYDRQVASDGPLAWYRLGEPSGSTMVDSADSHTGTCVNGVTNGRPGAIVRDANTARGFDGRAAYCYVNGITAPTSGYTIEGWMMLSAPKPGTIADHGGAGALYVTTTSYCMRNAWQSLCWASVPPVGSWHYVAATWSASDGIARLYVDGALRASAPNGARPSGSGTFYVGYGQSAPWFTGTLDEIAYYPTALSAARIAAHYHAGCGC